jgi:hypothetical protein
LTPDVSTNSTTTTPLPTDIILEAVNCLRIGRGISSQERIAVTHCVQMSSTNFSPKAGFHKTLYEVHISRFHPTFEMFSTLIHIWQMAYVCCKNENDPSQIRGVKFVVVMDYIGINMGKTRMVIFFLIKKNYIKS